jgi:hypothetical protein
MAKALLDLETKTGTTQTAIERETKKILVANGLDWQIIKLPLDARMDLGKPIGEAHIETDMFGLYNTHLKKVIANVKEGYHISQNEDIVKLVLEGIKGFGDLSVQKAWSINEGKRTLIQIAVEGNAKVGNDTIVRYITVIDSNDGSSSLAVGIGNLTLSCQNQFYKFYKSAQSKMRHTVSLESRMLEIPKLIRIALNEDMRLTETYRAFESTPLTRHLADAFVKEITGLDRHFTPIEVMADKKGKATNNMDALYSHIDKEMKQKGKNMWGLFSGLTSWNTHKEQKFKREDGKISSMTFGQNYKDNQKGLEFLMNKLPKGKKVELEMAN